MRQVEPEEYEEGEEYIADGFRWVAAPSVVESRSILQRKKYARMRAFLAAFAETGNIRLASGAAGIDRSTYYAWKAEETDIGAAFREALGWAETQATETLEAEARRRAVHGTRKVTKRYDKDGNVASEQVEIQYSDVLLIFLLKGLAPEKYRERLDVRGNLSHELKLQAGELADRYGLDADAVLAEAEAVLKELQTGGK